MQHTKTLSLFLIVLISVTTSNLEANAARYSVSASSREPTTKIIQMSSEEYSQLAEALSLLKNCCDASSDVIGSCKSGLLDCSDLYLSCTSAVDNLTEQNILLQQKYELTESRLSEVTETSWFDTAWDWFWPITSVVLGGVVYLQATSE